jgi:hypothetical protein
MRIITLTVTAALEDRVVQTDKELRHQLEWAVFKSMNADVVHVSISRIRDVQIPDPDDEATIVEWQQRVLTELHAAEHTTKESLSAVREELCVASVS